MNTSFMPDWLKFVDEKRQKNLVNILKELSSLQDKRDLNFIIIGALPLLISSYLKYIVYWDIDLLFKDKNKLKKFINNPKSVSLRIVNYDEDLMINENITSLHTAWTFTNNWFNVDYILRKGIFEFYTENIQKVKPYIETIKFNGEDFSLSLYLAHPWDIIVEKILSPRTEKDIELKVDMSIDIKHIFSVYNQESANPDFWDYILAKAKRFQKENELKRKFLKLLKIAKELGYDNIAISPLASQMLQK